MSEFESDSSKRLTNAYRGARSFMAKTPVTFLVWHLLIVTFGFVFVAAGIIMLIVPGPGALFIVLGIFVLSTEYTWAKRVMGPIRTIMDTVSNWWQDPTLRKIRRQVVGSFFLLMSVLVGWYLYRYGLSLDGFRALEELLTR